MKYSFHLSPVIIFILSTLGFSRTVYLQENFSNPTFPPAGWSIWQVGPATWQRAEESGNGYAKGEVEIDTSGWGYTTLETDEFILYKGDFVHLNFNRRNNFIGATPGTCQWVVALNSRSSDYYSNSFSPSEGQTWINADFDYYIPYTSDQWFISWTVGGEIWQPGQTTIFFDIDDVLIEEIGEDVEPASLGSIRAVFR